MDSPRGRRSNSGTPRSVSSSFRASVTEDCEIDRFWAARVTDPCSATATKYWSWRSVKAMIPLNHGKAEGGNTGFERGVEIGERRSRKAALRASCDRTQCTSTRKKE